MTCNSLGLLHNIYLHVICHAESYVTESQVTLTLYIELHVVLLGLDFHKNVQVGKDQEKAQSEKDSHSKNRGGKKPNQQSGTYTMKTFRKPNEQLFSQ